VLTKIPKVVLGGNVFDAAIPGAALVPVVEKLNKAELVGSKLFTPTYKISPV
jgi:hypothetical protein